VKTVGPTAGSVHTLQAHQKVYTKNCTMCNRK